MLKKPRKQAEFEPGIMHSLHLSTQSVLHTEYRYILVIHYFLFTMAAVTLYLAGAGIRQSWYWARGIYHKR
jgi:hypothetical protein